MDDGWGAGVYCTKRERTYRLDIVYIFPISMVSYVCVMCIILRGLIRPALSGVADERERR